MKLMICLILAIPIAVFSGTVGEFSYSSMKCKAVTTQKGVIQCENGRFYKLEINYNASTNKNADTDNSRSFIKERDAATENAISNRKSEVISR